MGLEWLLKEEWVLKRWDQYKYFIIFLKLSIGGTDNMLIPQQFLQFFRQAFSTSSEGYMLNSTL